MKKGINNENYKERRLLAAGICVFFIAVIVIFALPESNSGSEDDGVPGAAADLTPEPEQTEGSTAEAEPPASEPPEYIIIGGIEFDTDLPWLELTHMFLENDDIIPLQYMTNLIGLNLWDNQISDITPLSGLTGLSVLRLGGNPLSDLTPIANFAYLTELRLSNCLIHDLSPLAGLTALEHLTLRGNQINDITPLGNLFNLTDLGLDHNPITDWSPVAHLPNVSGRPGG
jgi:hypothetical protein